MRRKFTAPPTAARCTADIRLRDGSGAQCMRRAAWNSIFCPQHDKIDRRNLALAKRQLAELAALRSRERAVTARQRWAIRVVWKNGEEEYLKEGTSVAIFRARSRADEQAEFMLEGMRGDVQSINVVRAPRP